MQLLPHNEKGELRFFVAKTVLYDKIELKAIARSTWQPLPGLLPCHPHTLVKSLQLIWSSDTRIGNIFRHRWLLRRLGACKINFKCVSMTYKELEVFLIHWDRDKVADISQIFFNSLFWMKIYELRLMICYWILFRKIQLTISHCLN